MKIERKGAIIVTSEKIRALNLLVALAIAGSIFVPAVSALIAHNASGVWLDDFDYFLEPGDISGDDPEINITPPKKISEEEAKSRPGLILLDTKNGTEFKEIGAEGVRFHNENMSITLTGEADLISMESGNFSKNATTATGQYASTISFMPVIALLILSVLQKRRK